MRAQLGARSRSLLREHPNAGAVQYGLIAEEVAKVYPELVIRDEAGVVQGVRYEELTPLLLSQSQQQQRKIDLQAAEIASFEQHQKMIESQLAQLRERSEAVQAVLSKLQRRDEQLTSR